VVTLSAHRGAHTGPLAIVGNGSSVRQHDLRRLKCPVMTVNRAWARRLWPDHHVALDQAHREEAPAIYADMADRGLLWVAGEKWKTLKNAHVMKFTQGEWSDDIEQGVVESINGTGSVVFAALQLAKWMGYGPLYIYGLDLTGPRFDGTSPSPDLIKQSALFHVASRHVEAYLVGSPGSLCTAFPHAEIPAELWTSPKEEMVRMMERLGEQRSEAVAALLERQDVAL
jgi:hypothetical protein